jgi:hypothetical protein
VAPWPLSARPPGAALEIGSSDVAVDVRVVSKKRLDRAKGPHFPDPIHPLRFKRPLCRDVERHFALDLHHLISVVRHNATIWTTDRKTRTIFTSIVLLEGSNVQTDANIVLRDRGSIVHS